MTTKNSKSSKPRGGKPASAKAKAAKPKGDKKKAPETQAPSNSLCPVSHLCGACTAIDVPYDRQLVEKQQRIVDLFWQQCDKGTDLRFIKGMSDPFHYRNKVISPFAPGKPLPPKKGDNRGKHKAASPRRQILTGMYAAGTHRLVDTSACLLENQTATQIIAAIKGLMGKFGIEPYDEDEGTGFIRHAVVRVGHTSGEILVTLVTNGREFPGAKAFARELVKKVPAITTVVQNVNTRRTNVILGNEEQVIYGPGFILDNLCGLSFRISSTSFYQVSAGSTQELYETAMQLVTCELPDQPPLPQSPVVLDAYCGTGTIGLVAASRMEGAQVIGVDSVASAIADARLNARHNGITNAEFVASDAGAFMQERAAKGLRLDVLLMDPPRAGSDEAFLTSAVVADPARIVYISCNPETQARDVAFLQQRGYELRVVQPVDMFPHTDHIECVCLLVKTSGEKVKAPRADAAFASEPLKLAGEAEGISGEDVDAPSEDVEKEA